MLTDLGHRLWMKKISDKLLVIQPGPSYHQRLSFCKLPLTGTATIRGIISRYFLLYQSILGVAFPFILEAAWIRNLYL